MAKRYLTKQQKLAAGRGRFHSRYRIVQLKDKVPSEEGVQWTSATLPRRLGSPLASVRYKLDGKLQGEALRVDLGKGVFLDKPDDKRVKRAIERHGSEIVSVINTRGLAKLALGSKKPDPFQVKKVEYW